MDTAGPALRVGILASGRGTATGELLRAAAENDVAATVALLLTDSATAPVLARAQEFGVPAEFLDPAGLSRELYDLAVTGRLRAAGVNLVLMAGYRRIVSHAFVETWRGRLLNVHPSLLPAFAGLMDLRVHQAVLASGVGKSGCTIHHVTEAVDAGEIVLQRRCAVLPGDTPETLKDRVQQLENGAFVDVVRAWKFSGKPPGLAAGPPAKQPAEQPAAQPASQPANQPPQPAPLVGIVMGSRSDWPTLEAAAEVLAELGIACEAEVVSAHRTPLKMVAYAQAARGRGLQVLIAGAGGAAHLPGMLAALTSLPVLGVPVQSKALHGLDSLLSIVQMPGGVPVATFAIGPAGAKNAGLFAASMLALHDAALRTRLDQFRQRQTDDVLAAPDPRA